MMKVRKKPLLFPSPIAGNYFNSKNVLKKSSNTKPSRPLIFGSNNKQENIKNGYPNNYHFVCLATETFFLMFKNFKITTRKDCPDTVKTKRMHLTLTETARLPSILWFGCSRLFHKYLLYTLQTVLQ